jgi:hypothetical protein
MNMKDQVALSGLVKLYIVIPMKASQLATLPYWRQCEKYSILRSASAFQIWQG